MLYISVSPRHDAVGDSWCAGRGGHDLLGNDYLEYGQALRPPDRIWIDACVRLLHAVSLRLRDHSELVDGLTSNSVYHYHVRSRDVAGTLAGSSDFKFVSRATDFAVRITFDAKSTGTLNEQYPTGVIPWGNGTWLGSRTVVAFSGNCTSLAGEGYFVGSFRF